MSKLYSELARVYHEMYQNIFDYKEEYKFYEKYLLNNESKRVLEIGCGSGNLAPYFLNAGYQYVGLDLSQEMLDIAKEMTPKGEFVRSDMREIHLTRKFDAVIISGRSFAYLETNQDVLNTLKSVFNILEKGGILIFDNFDAEKIISLALKQFEQESSYQGKKYKRLSIKTPNLKHGWTENWEATYYIEENGGTRTIKDKAILRSFTKDEIKLFLTLQDFTVQELIEDDPTFTIIAKK